MTNEEIFPILSNVLQQWGIPVPVIAESLHGEMVELEDLIVVAEFKRKHNNSGLMKCKAFTEWVDLRDTIASTSKMIQLIFNPDVKHIVSVFVKRIGTVCLVDGNLIHTENTHDLRICNVGDDIFSYTDEGAIKGKSSVLSIDRQKGIIGVVCSRSLHLNIGDTLTNTPL
jgi:hypothetical protein